MAGFKASLSDSRVSELTSTAPEANSEGTGGSMGVSIRRASSPPLPPAANPSPPLPPAANPGSPLLPAAYPSHLLPIPAIYSHQQPIPALHSHQQPIPALHSQTQPSIPTNSQSQPSPLLTCSQSNLPLPPAASLRFHVTETVNAGGTLGVLFTPLILQLPPPQLPHPRRLPSCPAPLFLSSDDALFVFCPSLCTTWRLREGRNF